MKPILPSALQPYFDNLVTPQSGSHKGQNGKLLLIGGSELFHAASKWSLDIASKFVDMVFYASVPSNNELVKEAKGEFWNGIVIDRTQVESYIEEADCILIGPGMTRDEHNDGTLNNESTSFITNSLLKKYRHKKWVLDAGALQMVEPKLLNENCVITPHSRELAMVFEKIKPASSSFEEFASAIGNSDTQLQQLNLASVRGMSAELGGATLVIKGYVDFVGNKDVAVMIAGGNAGMTKGGTGDVLAGLIAALYATNDVMTAAVVGSWSNKAAGDSLAKKVGPFFNASELVTEIPTVLAQALGLIESA